jgi:hypothetical protein
MMTRIWIEGWMNMVPPPDQQPNPPGKTRKVVQVSQGSEVNPVVVLCDDASVWFYSKGGDVWTRVRDIPQDG